MDKHGSMLTYVLSGLSIALGFLNENAAAIGVLLACGTFVINWWYKRKQLEILKNGITNPKILTGD